MPPVMLVLLFFNCAVAAPATAPLPDPLVMNAGHKVETVQDRQARRGEMLEILPWACAGGAGGVGDGCAGGRRLI